jgi:hypothetical protein
MGIADGGVLQALELGLTMNLPLTTNCGYDDEYSTKD